jgi:hypothetical protein
VARAQLQVEGLKQLRRELKAAGVSLQDLKDAHAEVAALVIGRAHFTPKNPGRSTGRLAGSVRGSGTQSAAIVRAGRASVPYAGPIHWGWPSRNITAQPWLWDAAQDSRDEWTGLYLTALEKIIDSIEGAERT